MARPIKIPLVNGRGIALVDRADADKVSGLRWYLHSCGYASRPGGGPLMHRMILDAPKGVLVDHRDGNKLNNVRANLRLVDHSTNGLNRQRVHPRTSTGVRGIQRRANGHFYVWIWKNNINHYLGMRLTLYEAAILRREGELEFYGEIAPTTAEWLATHAKGGG